MENNEEQQATMDFEAIHERQNEELTERYEASPAAAGGYAGV